MKSETTESPVTTRYGEDRRSAPRAPSRLVARLAHLTGSIFGHLEDISPGGASFMTSTMDPELADGIDVVLILFSPPNAVSAEVHCTARIVRSDDFVDDTSESMVYGVEFDEPLNLDIVVESD